MNRIDRRLVLITILGLTLAAPGLFGCALLGLEDNSDDPVPTDSLVETLELMENHVILLELLDRAELRELLHTGGDFTIFAPSDAAFAKLGNDRLNELRTNTAELTRLLRNHVSSDVRGTRSLLENRTVNTLAETTHRVRGAPGGGTLIAGVAVAEDRGNIAAMNGVIHVMDGIIPVPES